MIVVDGDRSEQLKEYFKSFDRFYICDNNEGSISNCINRILTEKKSFEVPLNLNPKEIAKEFLR